MAERVLGLDVGTSAVRVVEVALEDRPVVRAFGEVPLPAGAARDGEVVDPAAVGKAISELWKQTGLRQHDVRLGLASQRVVVRTIELPAMPDDELAGAVRFSAQDHIPIPLDEAMLDFAVLESFTVEGESGSAPEKPGAGGVPEKPGAGGVPRNMVRVLVAAAHKEVVQGLMEAAAAGGVRVTGVDLVPFALVRALAGEPVDAEPAPDDAPPWARADDDLPEAIVSVGAGVTTVVVHEAGRPRFVRTVAMGGDALTTAVADELGVTPEAAEAAKRSRDHDDDLAVRAARVVDSRLAGILGEVQGSLHYWMASADRQLGRVLLTGGGTLTDGLQGRVEMLLGTPVEPAALGDRVDVAVDGGADFDAMFTVALGLALGAKPAKGGRIDLCPTRPRKRTLSRRTLVTSAAVAAGLVVVMGGLTVLGFMGVASERSKLAAAERERQRLAAQVAELDDVARVTQGIEGSRQRVSAALVGDVAWTRLLEGLAQGLPEGVWLSAFSANAATPTAPTATTGTVPAGTASAAPAAAPGGTGTVSFTATGVDYPAVASWLEEIPEQPALAAVSVGALTKNEAGGQAVVSFSSTAVLTPAAGSDRAQRLVTSAKTNEAGR